MGTINSKVTPLIGESDFTRNIYNIIQTVSKNTASVLLIGERGTGKRLIAQNIHYAYCIADNSKESVSNYNKKDFYEINCKTFKSADIKMITDGISRFVPAGKKITLFVNYISELSLQLQKDLLDCIKIARQNGILMKVVCSAEFNIEEMVSDCRFLPELYYQINAVVLNTVPLRLRKDDIIPIAEYYRELFKSKSGLKFTSFSNEARNLLIDNYWKGNIDELINAVQKAFIVGCEPIIKVEDLGIDRNAASTNGDISAIQSNNGDDRSLKTAVDSFKKEYITRLLEENNWNQTKTAKILGIQRTYVIKLIHELNIRK